jgi:NitT/TauT family transport system substrate-binding protein
VRTALAALAFVVLAVAGCGDDDGGREGGGQARVRVQDTAGVPSAFVEYGVQRGFFEDRQLDV